MKDILQIRRHTSVKYLRSLSHLRIIRLNICNSHENRRYGCHTSTRVLLNCMTFLKVRIATGVHRRILVKRVNIIMFCSRNVNGPKFRSSAFIAQSVHGHFMRSAKQAFVPCTALHIRSCNGDAACP